MDFKVCKKCGILKDEFQFRVIGDRGSIRLCSQCIECERKEGSERRHSVSGMILGIYHSQMHISKRRGHTPPNYSREELYNWITSQDSFLELYNNWVESEYEKELKPSCDRLDDYLPYTFSNLRLVSWRDNRLKNYSDVLSGVSNKCSKGVIQETLNGEFVNEFYSMAQVERELGIQYSSISKVCNGHRNKAGGFHWRYAEPE